MRPSPSSGDRSTRGRRHAGGDVHAAGGGDAREDAVLQLTQEQMLVNQALVERIFAYERATEALRLTEQKLHDLIAHQLAAREAERKRLSRELHDSLAQNLLALRMDISTLLQHTGERHQRLHDRAGAALDNVDASLRAVKQLLGELQPTGLELGLQATLELEVRKFTRASGIACTLEGGAELGELVLAESTVLTVYRVLQECLNNVFRHSLASRVGVRLGVAGGMLEMAVSDNGIGFDTEAPAKSSSYGLLDLRERVAAGAGSLRVTSARTHGTDVLLRLPLETDPSAPAAIG
ncbi:sensor histidine kinase [Massilia sp. DD77]|uniref:sensor histidine kinase n=1 Tax=Massilia sp. DD77 TaxID=3109349 RepID=UPI0030007312